MSLAAVLTVFTVGCTPSVSGVDAMPSPQPDTGAPAPDVFQPVPEAGFDSPSTPDAGSVDLPGELQIDAQPDALSDAPADAPAGDTPKWWAAVQPWPPPGTAYLTKLESQAQYSQLGGNRGVPFIIRRRANDQAYPYPWDSYECVFEPPGLHLEFLEMIDPERALYLYYNDAKSAAGTLIPGRLSITATKVVSVSIENFQGLTVPSASVYFPLDATVTKLIRERIMRCVPFGTTFNFSMICPDGSTCPMP